jgi:membrane associated rhomboid family serine protease
MQQFQQPGGFSVMPEVVKNLLIINVLVMLAIPALKSGMGIDLTQILGLHVWTASEFRPWQFITTMFVHGNFSHLLFNMFTLWMFGSVLENIWGAKRFLTFYLLTGIGAALLYSLSSYFELLPQINLMNAFLNNPGSDTLLSFTQNHQFVVSEGYNYDIYKQYLGFEENFTKFSNAPDSKLLLNDMVQFVHNYKEYFLNLRVAVGASGAVYGLLMAYGIMFPNQLLYVYFLFPIKAKYLVIILGLAELFLGMRNSPGDNVAHYAHLGGMLFGFILLRIWKQKRIY